MLLTAIVSAVVLAWAVESGVGLLNQRSARDPLAPEVTGLYDPQERERSIAYSSARFRLGLLSSSLSTGVLVVALVAGWFAAVDTWARTVSGNQIVVSLLFFAVLALVSQVLSLPFAAYNVFVLEERFGFNRTTVATFVGDVLKGMLLMVLIGGPLVTVILLLHLWLQSGFWWAAWLVVLAFSVFMFMFSTSLVLPLFNKLTPVPEGELRTEVEQYCASQGYALGRLFLMDGSKRSSKANAFFSGLGRRKTIVLFDTLVDRLSTREVVAVLAHEIGHWRLRHTLVSFLAGSAQSLVLLGLLGWLLQYPQLSEALGAGQSSFHLSALAFVLLYSPVSMAMDLVLNGMSRRNEVAADAFAARTFDRDPMATALRTISADSLANATPHPWYVALHHTHPPLAERLRHLASA